MFHCFRIYSSGKDEGDVSYSKVTLRISSVGSGVGGKWKVNVFVVRSLSIGSRLSVKIKEKKINFIISRKRHLP